MILLSFRIRRPNSIGSMTAGRPGVQLQTWCNLETDFVQVIADDPRQIQRVTGAILKTFGPNIVSAPAADASAILVPCPASAATSVSLMVERHGGLVQPPIVSADGWDQFRVVLFNDAKAPKVLAELSRFGEFEVVSKKPIKDVGERGFFVPSNELFYGLTRRQAEAVMLAANHGYYQEPRATTLSTIAQKAGLGRASLEEHLRKAENRILTALVPFVSVRAAHLRATQPRGRPFARNNRHQSQQADRPAQPRAPRQRTR